MANKRRREYKNQNKNFPVKNENKRAKKDANLMSSSKIQFPFLLSADFLFLLKVFCNVFLYYISFSFTEVCSFIFWKCHPCGFKYFLCESNLRLLFYINHKHMFEERPNVGAI